MVINETKSFCCECKKLHPATVKSDNNKIYFEVSCPIKTKKIMISSDAELFLSIRKKSYCDFTSESSNPNYSWENIIEVTNDCNFTCPVCFASIKNKKTFYLNQEEILKRILFLKKKKRKLITLSGGEPTLHPELLNILKTVKKQGLTAKMLTNGSVIGNDKNFAEKLKKHGIEYVFIQFDSLDKKTHKIIRNNDNVELKKQALQNAKKADLQIGTNTMFIKKNLMEIRNLIKYFLKFTPNLGIISFICAGKTVGRFELKNSDIVYREDVINAIIKSNIVPNLKKSHFFPLPKYSPIGLDMHPDCVALLMLAVNNNKIEPLDNYIDVKKLYRLMAKTKMKNKIILGSIYFIFLILKSVRPKKLITSLKMFYGYIFRKGSHSFVMLIIEQFMNEVYQDIQRLKHCTTYNVLGNDKLINGCIFNHPDKRRAEYIRKNI